MRYFQFSAFFRSFLVALRVMRFVGWRAFLCLVQVWHLLKPCDRRFIEKTSFGTPQPGQGICFGQIKLLTFGLRFLSRTTSALEAFLLVAVGMQILHSQTPLAGIWSTRTIFWHPLQMNDKYLRLPSL